MHRNGPHGQQWPDCDAEARERVAEVAEAAASLTPDSYLGTYLHGSLATGCYYPPKSDIDLLVVVSRPLSPAERRHAALSVATSEEARRPVGGIEMTAITADTAATPPQTPPYEVQYSPGWHRRILSNSVDWTAAGEDGDLSAHLAMAGRRGIAVDGPPVSEVFGAVAWSDYTAAVLADFDWITAEQGILESPFYGILNICRTLELLSRTDRNVLSKEEGALWALSHLPEEHHPAIQQALRAYRSALPVPPEQRITNGESWDRNALLALCRFARSAAPRA